VRTCIVKGRWKLRTLTERKRHVLLYCTTRIGVLKCVALNSAVSANPSQLDCSAYTHTHAHAHTYTHIHTHTYGQVRRSVCGNTMLLWHPGIWNAHQSVKLPAFLTHSFKHENTNAYILYHNVQLNRQPAELLVVQPYIFTLICTHSHNASCQSAISLSAQCTVPAQRRHALIATSASYQSAIIPGFQVQIQCKLVLVCQDPHQPSTQAPHPSGLFAHSAHMQLYNVAFPSSSTQNPYQSVKIPVFEVFKL
jgi:hypothetical protein